MRTLITTVLFMVMGNFMTLRYNLRVIYFMMGVFNIGDFNIYPIGKIKDLFETCDIWEIGVTLFDYGYLILRMKNI